MRRQVGKLDTDLASLSAEIRATQKSEQDKLSALTEDVEDLKDSVEELKSRDQTLELRQMELKTKISLPASVAGVLTAIGALIAALVGGQ